MNAASKFTNIKPEKKIGGRKVKYPITAKTKAKTPRLIPMMPFIIVGSVCLKSRYPLTRAANTHKNVKHELRAVNRL